MNDSPTTITTFAPSLSAATKLPPIAFLGKAGAGKTSAAEALQKISYKYYRVSFANTLKDAAVLMWGPDARTNRAYLQGLGRKVREIDPDVWLNSGLREIDEFLARGAAICNDDCRFPNEYDALAERGFTFVRLEATEEARVDRLQRNGKLDDISQLQDATETGLDNHDEYPAHYVIDTTTFDPRFEDLNEAVRDVLYKLERRT